MDLLATVRKEGSRGGRADFKWSDVQNSTRREHYLGHSLMAPVGRWAKGRDLNWYAKGDGQDKDEEDPAQKAARERKEEIRRVKEAEEDALARALGLPVPERNNANMEPVSAKRHTDRTAVDPVSSTNNGGKGLGSGHIASSGREQDDAEAEDRELQYALREHRRRHRDDDRKPSAHDRDRDRRHRSDKDRDAHRRRHRDRSREKYSHSRRSRSISPPRREQSHRAHGRPRSRSPSRSRSPDRSRRRDSRRH